MKKIVLLSLALTAGVAITNAASDKYAARELPTVVKVQPTMMKTAGEAVNAELAPEIDYVSADGDLAASYTTPVGFFWGISEAGNGYPTFLLYPGYTELTWTNTSTGADSYTWSYTDPSFESETPLVATSKDLTVKYPFASVDPLELTAGNGTDESTYSFGNLLRFGGPASYNDVLYGACTYDIGNTTSNTRNTTVLGGTEVADANWLRALGSDFTSTKVMSFCNLYPQPAHSYSMSYAYVNFFGAIAAGTDITVNVYEMTADGVGGLLAKGVTTVETAFKADTFNTISFTLKGLDSEGFETDEPVTINSAILVELEGIRQDGVTDFAPIWRTGVTAVTSRHAYVGLDYVMATGETGRSYYPATKWRFGSEPYIYCTDFEFQTDATFSWLEAIDTNDVSVTSDGGSVTVPINSYWYSRLWTIADDADGDGKFDSAPWLGYEIGDDTTNNYSYITLTAEPATDARSYKVQISSPGSSMDINFGEGGLSVGGVKVTSNAKVAVEDGNFAVSAPESITEVNVYSVTGQLVKTAAVAGATTIDAQDLANGLYILKFNDGSSVKVVK